MQNAHVQFVCLNIGLVCVVAQRPLTQRARMQSLLAGRCRSLLPTDSYPTTTAMTNGDPDTNSPEPTEGSI